MASTHAHGRHKIGKHPLGHEHLGVVFRVVGSVRHIAVWIIMNFRASAALLSSPPIESKGRDPFRSKALMASGCHPGPPWANLRNRCREMNLDGRGTCYEELDPERDYSTVGTPYEQE